MALLWGARPPQAEILFVNHQLLHETCFLVPISIISNHIIYHGNWHQKESPNISVFIVISPYFSSISPQFPIPSYIRWTSEIPTTRTIPFKQIHGMFFARIDQLLRISSTSVSPLFEFLWRGLISP